MRKHNFIENLWALRLTWKKECVGQRKMQTG